MRKENKNRGGGKKRKVAVEEVVVNSRSERERRREVGVSSTAEGYHKHQSNQSINILKSFPIFSLRNTLTNTFKGALCNVLKGQQTNKELLIQGIAVCQHDF